MLTIRALNGNFINYDSIEMIFVHFDEEQKIYAILSQHVGRGMDDDKSVIYASSNKKDIEKMMDKIADAIKDPNCNLLSFTRKPKKRLWDEGKDEN